MEGNVLGTRKEISIASDGNSQISHVSQLRNPFLGLPLDFGPCESFCTSEAGKCEGHFGSVELPVPIYHPSHVTELKRMLSLVCLKLKKIKDVSAAQIPIREVKTADGACYLALKVPNSKMHVSFWSLLEKYDYHYEGDHARDLLLSESIASDGNSQISHVSQLRNPFLGLPLDFGPCESFCTSEAGKCEGHFGSVELPVPIYHPSHVTELKRMLSLVCLKLKKIKDVSAAQIPIREVKTADGACYLALKVPNSKMHVSFWSLLEKYGYHYEGDHARDLLLSESIASDGNSQISHVSQLRNPFLGLPLDFGPCESFCTSEAGKCEGHFGSVELPVPIYHPSHVTELKRMLSLVCLKLKKIKDVSAAQIPIREVKTADGACYLALKVPNSKMHVSFWSLLEKYGYRYEGDHARDLLLSETRRKTAHPGEDPDNIVFFDPWREHLSEVYDQEDIQACFAFASAYALEAMCSIKNHRKIQISRQDIVNNLMRTKYQRKYGCNTEKALVFMRTNGVILEEDCPFVNKICQLNYTRHVVIKVKRFQILTEIAAVEHRVKNFGPVIGRFLCPEEFSELDDEGSIFRMKDLPTENCQNHAVLIVGYGARRIRGRNIKFWKIQNSWGTTWADRGYGLISQVCESGEPVFSKFWFITDVRDVGL